jgi:hypothetical protein
VSAAWASLVLTVVLLLPGVGFFFGFWAKEPYARELVKSAAIGEVGLALFAAIWIHLIAWCVLWLIGFDAVVGYFAPLADYVDAPAWLALEQALLRLPAVLLYVVITTVVGGAIGYAAGWAVMSGPLRVLGTHKWAYDIIKQKREGIVTAYLMTNTIENNKVLMYAGHLKDFYLDANGCFAYVVLEHCSSFYMDFGNHVPTLGEKRSLFRVPAAGVRRLGDLVVNGENIANILLDSLGSIDEAEEGTKALDDALAETELLEEGTSG